MSILAEMLDLEFTETAKVEKFPGKGGWTYVRVPKVYSEMGADRAVRGFIPIIAKVGQTKWKTSLLPFGDGTHFIALKANVRKLEKISESDIVEYSFKFID